LWDFPWTSFDVKVGCICGILKIRGFGFIDDLTLGQERFFGFSNCDV
jgi:hypothetical protein